MPTSGNKINFFWSGSKADFTSATKNADALYFIKESGVYVGENKVIDASDFECEKVKQNYRSTTNWDYPVLLGMADTTSLTDQVMETSWTNLIKFNPSVKTLKIGQIENSSQFTQDKEYISISGTTIKWESSLMPIGGTPSLTASQYSGNAATATTATNLAAAPSVDGSTAKITAGNKTSAAVIASTTKYGFVKMDSTPTSGSNNAVTSGGLYTYLSNFSPGGTLTGSDILVGPDANDHTGNYDEDSSIVTALNYLSDEIANMPYASVLSDPNIFQIIFTLTDGERTVTANRTYQQLLTAWQGKKYIVGKFIAADSSNSEWGQNYPQNWLACSKDEQDTFYFNIPDGVNRTISYIEFASGGTVGLYSNPLASSNHTHTNVSMGQGYGTTTTSASQATKTVTLSNYMLIAGGIVSVYFTYAHTASSLSLNINTRGTKAVYYNNSTTAIGAGVIDAGDIATFIYDGTYYRFLGVNSTFHNAYGTNTETATTTARTVAITNYKLKTGGIVSVKFQNLVPASATLNINSTGAKNIYWRGSALVSGVIGTNDTVTFMYDGTQYQIISIDKEIPTTGSALIYEGQSPHQYFLAQQDSIDENLEYLENQLYKISPRYVHKTASSGTVTFSSSAKMAPNVVYCIGSSNKWTTVSTITFDNSSLDTTNFGSFTTTTTSGSMPTDSSQVPIYCMIFTAGGNISWTLPSNVKWVNDLTPTTVSGHFYEFMIMNNIATLNGITNIS